MKRWWIGVVVLLVLGAVAAAIWSAREGSEPPASLTDAPPGVPTSSSASASSVSVADPSAFYYQEEFLGSDVLPAQSSLAQKVRRHGDDVVRLVPDTDGEWRFRSVLSGEWSELEFPSEITDGIYDIFSGDVFHVRFDAQLQSIVLDQYQNGGERVDSVPLRESDIFVFEERIVAATDMAVDDRHIFVEGVREDSSSSFLEVFGREGALLARHEFIKDFEAGHSLYLVSTGTDAGNQRTNVYSSDDELLFSVEKPLIMLCFSQDGRMVFGMDLILGSIVGFSIESEGEDYREFLVAGRELSFLIPSEEQIPLWLFFENGHFYLTVTKRGTNYGNLSFYRYTRTEGERPTRDQIVTVTLPYLSPFILNVVSHYELERRDVDIVLDYAHNSRDEFLSRVEDYRQKLSLRIASGEVGDIVMIGGAGIDLASALASDAFVDLSDRVKTCPEYPDLIVPLLDSMKVHGALRGLPISFGGAMNCLGVDADFLDALPGTGDLRLERWSDALELVPIIAANFPDRKLMFTTNWSDSAWDRLGFSILSANIDSLIDFEHRTIQLNPTWFTDLLREFKELSASPVMKNPEPETEWGDYFTDALFSDSVSYRGAMRDDLLRYLQLASDRRCKLIGSFTGEVAPNRVIMSRMVYAIASHSEKKDAAWDFLAFLLSPKMQRLVASDQYPINRSVYPVIAEQETREGGASDAEYFIREVLRVAESVTRGYDYGLPIRLELHRQIGRYMSDELTLEDALAEAESRIRILLNE